MVKYKIPSAKLLGTVSDNCATNLKLGRMFQPLHPNGFRLPCWCHVIDNAGNLFLTPVLDQFFTLYTAVFSHSAKMKVLWKAHFGKVPRSHSATRWFSKYEVIKEAFDKGWIANMREFLGSAAVAEADVLPNASVRSMIAWYEYYL